MSTKNLNTDVLVVGGGPAGMGAALAAARNSAKTLLIEGSNTLGGVNTQSLIPMIRTAGDGGGIVREYWERLKKVDGVTIDDIHAHINPCMGRIISLEMMEEASVKILFHTFTEGVEVKDRTFQGVYIANKGGRQFIESKITIDATGDGDLAAWAGVPFDKGREGDGYLQAVSLNFILAGVDTSKLSAISEFRKTYQEIVDREKLDIPRALGFIQTPGMPSDFINIQCDMAHHIDATQPESLTRGEIICHQRVLKIFQVLKKNFEAFHKAVMINIATRLGIRETRRIKGEKTLTEQDVLEGRKHPDGVSRCSWYMDLHDGQAKHTATMTYQQYRASLSPPPGDFYEIPYGCMIPLEIENLLVSGRSISSTRLANGSSRLQITCMNLGQAAGLAAALAIKEKTSPRKISGTRLRSILKEQGADL